jgi:hypothetical protein
VSCICIYIYTIYTVENRDILANTEDEVAIQAKSKISSLPWAQRKGGEAVEGLG